VRVSIKEGVSAPVLYRNNALRPVVGRCAGCKPASPHREKPRPRGSRRWPDTSLGAGRSCGPRSLGPPTNCDTTMRFILTGSLFKRSWWSRNIAQIRSARRCGKKRVQGSSSRVLNQVLHQSGLLGFPVALFQPNLHVSALACRAGDLFARNRTVHPFALLRVE